MFDLTRQERQPFRAAVHLERLGIDVAPIRRAERVLEELSAPRASSGPNLAALAAAIDRGADAAELTAQRLGTDPGAVAALVDAAVELAGRALDAVKAESIERMGAVVEQVNKRTHDVSELDAAVQLRRDLAARWWPTEGRCDPPSWFLAEPVLDRYVNLVAGFELSGAGVERLVEAGHRVRLNTVEEAQLVADYGFPTRAAERVKTVPAPPGAGVPGGNRYLPPPGNVNRLRTVGYR